MRTRNHEKEIAMKYSALFACALLLSSAAYAQDPYDACTERAGTMNNSVVYECSAEASAVYKQEITAAYRKIHAALRERSQEPARVFEQAQHAWLDYRNKHCDLITQYVGGPMDGYCQMNLNKARAGELKELADAM